MNILFWKKNPKVEKARELPLCGNIKDHDSWEHDSYLAFPCPACHAIKLNTWKQIEEQKKQNVLAELIAEKVVAKLTAAGHIK
jgi:hypothetical protein